MANVAQATSREVFEDVALRDSFDHAAINSNSPEMARPLAMGSGSLTVGDKTESFDYSLSAPVDGKSTLEVNGTGGQELSSAGRFFSTIGAITTAFLKKHVVAAAATAAGLGLMGNTEKANGTLMHDGVAESGYRQIGEDMAGKAIWFGGHTATGAQLFGSAVRLNSEYGLTAAHNLTLSAGLATITQVGTGTNYLNNTGQTVGVDGVQIFPGFPADGNFYTPDIAIIHFATPLPGEDLTLASAERNQVLWSAGYGKYGTPSTGLLARDGNIRGFEARVDSDGFVQLNISPDYYMSTDFGFLDSGLKYNGRGASGDSGGPVFDATGNLVGIQVAATVETDSLGQTAFLNLMQPEVHSWIVQNTSVPEPSTVALFVIGAGSAGLMLRQRSNRD
jgi:hypothetical protein